MALEKVEPAPQAANDRGKSWLGQRWSELQATLSSGPSQPTPTLSQAPLSFDQTQAASALHYASPPRRDPITF
jgi:hypothetical protein